jgi:hypothetical protein
MGCGPSRATEASAYGVDATERVLDEPSAGRQTRACSRGEDARPHPEAPTNSGSPRRSVCTPRDDGEERWRGVDGRSPRDVPSPSALRWHGSLAATHPLASAASPPVPRPPSLPESTGESDDRDAQFTERDERDFTDLAFSPSPLPTATSSSASSLSSSRNAPGRSGSIAIEPNTVTVSDVSNAETNDTNDTNVVTNDDTDDDAAYREVLASAAAAVREAVDAVRVAAVPRNKKHEIEIEKKRSARDEDGEDFDESVFAFRAFRDTDERRERFRFVPGVGATTSRRAAAAAVAKTAMDLVSSSERARARRENGAAIRF